MESRDSQVGDTGPEIIADSRGKTQGAAESLADSCAFSPDFGQIDPDLAVVISAWPTLADAVRAGILTMVHQAGLDGRETEADA